MRLEECRNGGGVWTIDAEQAHHLVHVRRCSSGSIVEGLLGGERVTLELECDGGEVRARELSRSAERPAPVEIHLLLALLKSDQFDAALRFSAETGVHTIHLIDGARCVPKFDGPRLAEKIQRWRKVLNEATKQSGAASPPVLLEPVPLSKLDISSLPDVRLSAMLSPNAVALRDVKIKNSVAIAIGPEGDWSREEMDLFIENGFTPVSLGHRILRASTAVAVACGALSLLRDER